MVELRLLANPENSQRQEAHKVGQQSRQKNPKRAPEIVFAVNGSGGGKAKVQNHQRHGDGENAVAERGQALDALTRNAVVG